MKFAGVHPLILGILGFVGVGLAPGPAYAADVDTSPGKEAVFLSVDSKSMRLDLSPVFPPAVIEKGKKGHVLTVTATLFAFSFDDKALDMFAAVNNRFLEPPFSHRISTCPIGLASGCAGTATWVADLDALEQAEPGRFIGKPLTVDLGVRDPGNLSATREVSGTFIVRLERKK